MDQETYIRLGPRNRKPMNIRSESLYVAAIERYYLDQSNRGRPVFEKVDLTGWTVSMHVEVDPGDGTGYAALADSPFEMTVLDQTVEDNLGMAQYRWQADDRIAGTARFTYELENPSGFTIWTDQYTFETFVDVGPS